MRILNLFPKTANIPFHSSLKCKASVVIRMTKPHNILDNILDGNFNLNKSLRISLRNMLYQAASIFLKFGPIIGSNVS